MILADRLVETGLVPSAFVLDLNRCLTVLPRFNVPSFWNTRSRAFQFPIRVCGETLKVAHDFLKAHPFVKHVEETLELEIEVDETCNAHIGYHHALDLLAGNQLDVFEASREMCCDDDICSAIQFCLRSADKDAGPYLSLKDAKRILMTLGSPEPANCSLLRTFDAPAELTDGDKASYWPINIGRNPCPYEVAWTLIHGIEAGYFKNYGKGHLEWSTAGVDYYHGNSFGLLL